MIALFTDFGRGPYVGQMKARIIANAPAEPLIDLLHDAPMMDPRAASYLLEPFCRSLPDGAVVVAVVDPGVGTDTRTGCVMQADGRWYVGPDNGLFEFVCRRAATVRYWTLPDPGDDVSATFHGRDVFAGVAAGLALGELPDQAVPGEPNPCADWPDDAPYVLYIDDFGNAMTGIRGEALEDTAILEAGDYRLRFAATFGRMPAGAGFWHRNSSGLVEVAVNQGHAADVLGLQPGSLVRLVSP